VTIDERFEDLSTIPAPLHLAIGVFDGVHFGHRAVLRSALEAASLDRGSAVLVTFEPHPAEILRPDRAPLLLTSLAHKLRLVESLGVEHALIVPFTHDFSRTTAIEFVRTLHTQGAPFQSVSVGRDWRFGRDRAGDLTDLVQIGSEFGFEVRGVAPLELDGVPVRSTRIREWIREGRLKEASRFLGRPVSVLGTVTAGDRLGRELGYPTANLAVSQLQLPPSGVYAASALRDSSAPEPAVVNLGHRPTLDGSNPPLRLEAHLLDYEGPDFYGQDLEIIFRSRLRGETRIDSLEELRDQIGRDVRQARALLQN